MKVFHLDVSLKYTLKYFNIFPGLIKSATNELYLDWIVFNH